MVIPVTSKNTLSGMTLSKFSSVTLSFPYAIKNDGIVRENPRRWALTEFSILFFSCSLTDVSTVRTISSSAVVINVSTETDKFSLSCSATCSFFWANSCFTALTSSCVVQVCKISCCSFSKRFV